MCQGAQHWQCVNAKPPIAEACNGVDDNCNGAIDDGSFPGEGNTCGSNVGECKTGIIDCTNGILDCVGDVPPTQELCDGKDNDCDTVIDNGISTGGSCTPTYDTVAYPGPRDKGACQPGTLTCDGMGGLTCANGVGPSPEVCDGIDNDCDGSIDETGNPPDGIDGTSGPFAPPGPPVAKIGDQCGTDVGDCTLGTYACVMGQFQCVGGTTPQPESCDCGDNDCNGVNDNPNMNNSPPLCSPGKECVKSSQGCQCAAACGSGEFPCPTGQICEMVTDSQTGAPLGSFCVVSTCNDCPHAVVVDANNVPICGPAGTPTTGCANLPVCACAGQNGCKPPCFGVQCSAPLVCTNFGPNAGKCVADNCFNNPCQGCNQVCDDNGSCKDNPCPGTCKADEVCKPSADFNSFTCEKTCAGVMCAADKVCHDGMCVPTCSPACAADQVCDTTQMPPTCVQSKCMADSCPNGGCCDPLNGACGSCPCEGVICPQDQKCVNDECVGDMGTGGAASSSSASTGSSMGGNAATGSTSATGSGGSTGSSNGVFGLATGGGGCSCGVAGAGVNEIGMIVAALGIVAARYRRRRRPHRDATLEHADASEVSR
ncbi:MAG: MopE-related protein [Polyangiaceae bacterium]